MVARLAKTLLQLDRAGVFQRNVEKGCSLRRNQAVPSFPRFCYEHRKYIKDHVYAYLASFTSDVPRSDLRRTVLPRVLLEILLSIRGEDLLSIGN